MITSQLIGQVTESLIPYVMFRSRVTKVTKEGKKIVMKSADLSDIVERQATQEQYLVGYRNSCYCNLVPRLQNSPYFCVFKYAGTVKQEVWNEAENRVRDWGERLKIRFSRLTGRVRLALARFARKTLTPRFTDFFTDFEKKTRLFFSLLRPRA